MKSSLSNWNVEAMTAKYSSHPAKFRNLIREIKLRAVLRLAEVETSRW
jgi:hypothetical protein